MKTCNRCEQSLSRDHFALDSKAKDSLYSTCRACDKKRKQEYRFELVEFKVCPGCNIKKTGSEFHRHRGKVGGVSHYCKECRRTTSNKYHSVYFVACHTPKGVAAIKVGISKNVHKRVKSLNVGSPFNNILLGTIYKGAEKKLHNKMTPSRVRGEWFKTIPALETMKALNSTVRLTQSGQELLYFLDNGGMLVWDVV